MYSQKAIYRINIIYKKINFIENRLPIIKKSVEKILKDKNDIDDR